jgi:uncharacterized protein (PEP-CTERM system associated)
VLPPVFAGGANNTQTGGGVNYSYRLSELTNFVASANYYVTKPNNTQNLPSNNLRSNNFNVSASVGTQFSPRTSGSVGLTYFTFDTPGANNIPSQSTLSVYANINHTF